MPKLEHYYVSTSAFIFHDLSSETDFPFAFLGQALSGSLPTRHPTCRTCLSKRYYISLVYLYSVWHDLNAIRGVYRLLFNFIVAEPTIPIVWYPLHLSCWSSGPCVSRQGRQSIRVSGTVFDYPIFRPVLAASLNERPGTRTGASI